MNTLKINGMRRRHFAGIIRQRGYTVGAEIGVYKGKYSAQLLKWSNLQLLHCIDSWKPEHMCGNEESWKVADEAFERLQNYAGRVKIHVADSREAAKMFNDGSLDFVYIDAGHMYRQAYYDVKAWFPKVRDGGMISGHDFYPRRRIKNVKRALNRYFGDDQLIYLTDEPAASWWLFKGE